jgi:hypothetical protein
MSDPKPMGREGILASRSFRKSEVLDIDGLGTIRIMAPDTRGSLFVNKYKDTPEVLGAMFISLVVDEDGKPVFDFSDEAVAEIMELPASIVARAVNAGTAMFRPDVEAEIKNSEASATTDSPIS